MSNDKTYDRHINIWINGKEIENSAKAIKKEILNLSAEVNKLTIGTKEYNEKAAELKKLKGIYQEHQDNVKNTGSAWTKMKSIAESGLGKIIAGVGLLTGAFRTMKGVITSTGESSDKLEVTLAGWKSGLDAVARSLVKLDFKNLGKNIKEAIQEGRRYAENLDEIDDKSRALRVAEAKAANELLKQREIQNDVTRSLEDRNKAGKEAIRIEEDLQKIRTGLAEQAYKNELDNITSIAFGAENVNDLTRKQIELYLERDEGLLKSLEPAKKYREILQQISNLKSQEVYTSGALGGYGKAISKDKEVLDLRKQITDEMIQSNKLLTSLSTPTDEKYNLLTEKYVMLEEAKGSALEHTMKIRSKNAGIEDQLNDELDKSIDKSMKAIMTFDQFIESQMDLLKYNPDDFINSFSAAMEKEVSDQLINDQAVEEERKKMNEQRAAIHQERIDKEKADAKAAEEEKLMYAEAGFEALGTAADAFYESKRNKLQASMQEELAQDNLSASQKLQIRKKYAKLEQKIEIKKALINAALAIGKTFAEYGFTPVAWIAAALGAVKTAAEIATIKSQSYAVGGFTEPGGKYTPAGIVHAGEWVANAEMVSSPKTGPIIQALERERINMRGYAGGGYSSASNNTSGNGSGSLLSVLDPRIERILIQTLEINRRLLKEGVKTHWGYREVANVRRGMDRLQAIERDTSMR